MPILIDRMDEETEIVLVSNDDEILKIEMDEENNDFRLKIHILKDYKNSPEVFILNKKLLEKTKIKKLIQEWLYLIVSGTFYAGVDFDKYKILDKDDIKTLFER